MKDLLSKLFITFISTVLLFAIAKGQVPINSLNSNISENFNSLAAPSNTTGTSLPSGWYFTESGTNANAIYTVNNGLNNTGDTYSFGAASGSAINDRALGTLRSGTLQTTLGAAYTNNTGQVITQLIISFTGEYWRCGTAGRLDRLDFQISMDATSITSGNWTDINDLDFDNNGLGDCPSTTGNKDGSSCFKLISYSITNLNIAAGSTFYIRWIDLDASGADDGMAIDDFSLKASNANGGGTGSNLFIYDNVNNLVGLGTPPLVTPAVKFDVDGSLRVSQKMFLGVPNDKMANLASLNPGYRLSVNGSILATKIVIKKFVDWPDYVFSERYKLMPLTSLRSYISRYHHLPEIPAAKTVSATGYDIGKLQVVMLKKIEELTLYILTQQEKIDELSEELLQLKESRK